MTVPEIPPAHREAVIRSIFKADFDCSSPLPNFDVMADAAIATMLALGYRVAPGLDHEPGMTCNNCGGRMFRSAVNMHATVCRGEDGNGLGCGMRHDWAHIIAKPTTPHHTTTDKGE